MKKLLGGIALSALLAAPAMAADLPARMPVKAPPPAAVAVYNWSGCYIGVHGGYGWGNKRLYEFGEEVEFLRHTVDGWLIGGQVGCNMQNGQLVYGIEGQAGWADVDGETVFGRVGLHTEADILGTIAARIGWTFDRTLVYAKGGAAFAHEKHRFSFDGATSATSDSYLRWGWMVGGGVEHAFGNNWSAKVEYNYMHLGNKTIEFCTVAVPTVCLDNQIRQHLHVVKVGINYRWGAGAVVARY